MSSGESTKPNQNNGHEAIQNILASLGRDPDTAANILGESAMESMVEGFERLDVEDAVRKGVRTLEVEA